MKKLTVVLASILVAGVAYAQEAKKTEPAKPVNTAEAAKPAAKTHDVAAEVVSVDTAAKTITIKGEKDNTTLPFDEKVLASVKDFKAGYKTILVCRSGAPTPLPRR